jgi:membrane protein
LTRRLWVKTSHVAGGLVRVINGVVDAVRGGLAGARRRWPWFAHLARAYERYQERRGDRLAAGMTYFAFLSFFPLVALAYALLGYLVGISDTAREYFVEAINSLLPGLADEIPVERVAQAKTTAGLLGLGGLLVTGLGWVNALRESLREIFANDPTGGAAFPLKKVYDIGVVLYLGIMLMLSVAVTGITTQASHQVLRWVGLDEVPGAGTALRGLALAVAIGFDTLIFLLLFSRLSGTRAPWRRIIRGALFGAIGFELLKMLGSLLISSTTNSPVYASFAVMVGLLLWIDIVSRFTLFAAAWTATRRVILAVDGEHEDGEDGEDGEGKPVDTDRESTGVS